MNPELFQVGRVTTKATVYNLPDRLPSGLLPLIESAVNEQEVFDTSSRIARRFLRLEGENWDMEFDTRSIFIDATGFLDCHAVEEGVSFFLGQIKKSVHCHFWAGEVTVHATWPLEPNTRRKKTVGQILYEKSSRLKAEQLQPLLPSGGILGAGVSILGNLDDGTLWWLEAGPVPGDRLAITLEMTFPEPDRANWPPDELEVIEANIRRAYLMMNNEVKTFQRGHAVTTGRRAMAQEDTPRASTPLPRKQREEVGPAWAREASDEYSRFDSLARQLITVPKRAIDQKRKRRKRAS